MSSDRLAIGLLLTGLAVLACFTPVQSDTWWLLRGGQEIWTTFRVPLTDTYSHTAAGHYWPNHEWLTEALFYAAFRVGGLPLLVGLCAVSMTTAWLLIWKLCRGAFEWQFLLLVVSFTQITGGFAIRPQAFTMLCFALTCTCLVMHRLWWLPAIVLFWANAHGAVALGLAAIGASVAAALVKDRAQFLPRLAAFVVCVACTFVTPLGRALWTFVPESMARSAVNQLIEWQPPTAAFEYWPFWLVAAALLLLSARYWRSFDSRTTTLVAIAIVMLPLAVKAMRNIHIFLMAAIPAICAILAAQETVTKPRVHKGERPALNNALFGAGIAIGALVVGLAWWRPTSGMAWHPISAPAISAIRACPDRLYNTYGDGGILIWFVPERLVFIDNRQDPFPIDVLRASKKLESDGLYEDVFSRYGVNCAVVPEDSATAARLNTSPGWRRTFTDPRWTVFSR